MTEREDIFLRTERMPHIFCPGCGVGTAMNGLVRALEKRHMSPEDVHVVSGIGCSGRVAGYINTDSFHTTHGRALAFATGLSLARSKSKVVVFSGDGDITAIGGNHLMHAARRNVDMTVICLNNFTYGMTGGQVTPTTPDDAKASTTPFGNYEYTFNIPALVDTFGANYVARWTVYHVRKLSRAITKALGKRGFSFIEVLSPCPTLFMRRNKLGQGIDMLEYFRENTIIENGADTHSVALKNDKQIVVGEFVDRDNPSFMDCYNTHMTRHLGERFVPYKGGDEQ